MDPTTFRRKAVCEDANLVRFIEPTGGGALPLVALSSVDGVDLCDWLPSNTGLVRRLVHARGGVLFRGFVPLAAAELARVVRIVSGDPLAYEERSSPRTEIEDRIYTSTDYPKNQAIFPHCENSYQGVWPLKIFFLCITPPGSGGETPVADTRRVLARLAPSTRETFSRLGVMYVRNYCERLGLPWQEVFGTTDREQVDRYCLRHGLTSQWRGTRLRTLRNAPAIRVHPETGEQVWFNHAAFFNVGTLPSVLRQELSSQFEPMDLPNNTFFGDGSAIPDSVLEDIRSAYEVEMSMFPWREGDLLVLDNMLAAHARRPYQGDRRIAVGMSEPYSEENGQI